MSAKPSGSCDAASSAWGKPGSNRTAPEAITSVGRVTITAPASRVPLAVWTRRRGPEWSMAATGVSSATSRPSARPAMVRP